MDLRIDIVRLLLDASLNHDLAILREGSDGTDADGSFLDKITQILVIQLSNLDGWEC